MTLDEVRQAVEDGRCNAYTPLTLSEDVSEETAGLIEKGGYAGITVAVDHVRDIPMERWRLISWDIWAG